MVKVRMRGTVLFGSDRKRLERGKEYEVTKEGAESLVPRYANYVDGPPAEPEGNDVVLEDRKSVV